MQFLAKILPWLFALWILGFVLSAFGGVLSSLLTLVIYLFFGVIAVCCIYGLLPSRFRLAPIESWLGYTNFKQPKKTKLSSGKKRIRAESTKPKQEDSDEIEEEEDNEEEEFIEEVIEQPELDFSKIFAPQDKYPTREELKAKLQSKVIGQTDAIDIISRVTLGKLAAKKNNKPLVIMLPGPTGSGKTEISKALAAALDTKLVRFDMGEFADSFKSSNLFGSAKGYAGSNEGGALPNAIRDSKTKCVILFDEVEKAHQSLWRQLLAFFDEGRVKDTLGQVVAPKNTICLLTSNIEAENIAKHPDRAKDLIKDCGFFPPEFVGRINKIVPLLRLNIGETAKLAAMLAKRFADEYEINLIIHQESLNDLIEAVAEEADKYGGRGITEKVSDLLQNDLLDLQTEGVSHAKLVKQGDRLSVVRI